MRCVDNALRAGAGFGLDAFVIPEEASQPTRNPLKWPHLLICCDQGSDGLCAYNWLAQTQRFNGEFVSDPAHGIWNDQKLALTRCGLWQHTLLMTAMLNVPHGPWSEQRFFRKLADAHKEYLSTACHADCPFFNHYYLALVKDRGLEHELGDPDLPARIWSMLEDSWCMWTKGAKVGTSRWFAIGDAAGAFDSEWHSKLIAISYMMWEDGDLQTALTKKMTVLASSSNAEHAGEDRRTMAQAQKDVQLSRQACKNGLEFTFMLLTQPERQFTQRIIHHVGAELRRYHGEQVSKVRSTNEAFDWWLEQVSCGFWKHLNAIACVIGDQSLHERCGIEQPSLSAGASILGHPLVEDQMKMAEMLGDLVLATLRSRIQRWLPITLGWPTRSLVFLSTTNAQLRDRAVNALKHDFERWDRLGKETDAFAKKVHARSAFHLMTVKQLVSSMQDQDWQLTAPLLQWLEKKYRMPMAWRAPVANNN